MYIQTNTCTTLTYVPKVNGIKSVILIVHRRKRWIQNIGAIYTAGIKQFSLFVTAPVAQESTAIVT